MVMFRGYEIVKITDAAVAHRGRRTKQFEPSHAGEFPENPAAASARLLAQYTSISLSRNASAFAACSEGTHPTTKESVHDRNRNQSSAAALIVDESRTDDYRFKAWLDGRRTRSGDDATP